MFGDVYNFLQNALKPQVDPNSTQELALDFKILPSLIFDNLAKYPPFFKMLQPESYYGQDIDLHMQLGASVSVILNRKIRNPHMRIEFQTF